MVPVMDSKEATKVMNWNHVNAMCKFSGILRVAEVDGVKLASDGHMLFIVGDGFTEPPNKKEHPPMEKMWREWSLIEPQPSVPSSCTGEGKVIGRMIGDAFVAERYIRCFDQFATFTSRNVKDPVLVHLDGVLVGGIMPMSKPSEKRIAKEVTDSDVFGPYACAENDWYLIDAAAIEDRLNHAEREARNARERIEEAENELAEWRSEIVSLTQVAKRMKVLA